MGFFSTLFGGSSTGAEIVKGVSSAVDEMFYTDQEEAADAAQARREGYQVYITWLESTSGSRVARRVIALMITGSYFLQLTTAQVLAVASIWVDDDAKILAASDKLFGYAFEGTTLVGVVLLFYFGGPAAIDGVKGLVNKWTSSRDNK